MTGFQEHFAAQDATSLLGWWRDAGVDTLVNEAPRQWLGVVPAQKQRIAEVQESRDLPGSIAAFVEWLASSEEAELGPVDRRLSPQGTPGAPIMIMIDMPEVGDHQSGQLLSGDVGVLFDRMLAAVGLTREDVYLAPLCPARPATGQIAEVHQPRLAEIARHHIDISKPKRVWLLGQTTSRAILGVDAVAARGSLQQINLNGGNVEAVVSLHPRLLLQNPARKAGTWADMQLLTKGKLG